ncbi:LytR family transcriptional regulator [Labedella phragmitis]|uniref:LytR family transcriptional regulator n=1 Tax=Labedella phragmitis TaxID=2498849 RepID=A0A3S3Z6H1_9MICO|nr:LCP family protein [Labedella phragmitis]RWZ52881.1 LytR family transcriptional regulator [Labedella phragmitis]
MARSTRNPEPTLTRHARGRRRGPVAAVLRGVAFTLAVVLVSGAAVAAYAAWEIGAGIASNAVDIGQGGDTADAPSGIGELEGGFNMLVIGADNSANQNTSAYGKRDVTLNDVNMLVHVAADHQSAVVVSFPRDMLVPIPECTDPDTGEVHAEQYSAMINTAFAKGGEKGGLGCAAKTIEELTGLEVDYAAQFSFASVIQLTNALGGVEVCLADPIKDRFSGLDLDEGVSTIQGEQALQFLRTRKAVGDGSDLSRIALQQTYMSSLVKKLKSDGTLGDVTKLYGIAKVAAESLSLSSNLANINAMISMALTVRNLDLENIQLVQYPVGEAPSDPNRVVPQKETADQLMAAIAADASFSSDPDARRVGVEDTSTEEPADPETETPPSTSPSADPSTTPSAGATTSPPASGVIDGLVGQSAAQESCVVKN